MKAITLALFIIIISTFHSNPFDKFISIIPDGWLGNIDKNKLVISRDSSVKIQYFDYGMEANPPILDHKMEIVIECKKRLSNREIEKRKIQRDSLLSIYKRKFNLDPSKVNWAKYEMIQEKLDKNSKYLVPIHSDDQYSYFMYDNFPDGYIFLNESEKNEIDDLIFRLRKLE